jgi:hypothetical protein
MYPLYEYYMIISENRDKSVFYRENLDIFWVLGAEIGQKLSYIRDATAQIEQQYEECPVNIDYRFWAYFDNALASLAYAGKSMIADDFEMPLSASRRCFDSVFEFISNKLGIFEVSTNFSETDEGLHRIFADPFIQREVDAQISLVLLCGIDSHDGLHRRIEKGEFSMNYLLF